MNKLLTVRRSESLIRSLPAPNASLIDFTSNDYLGMAMSPPSNDGSTTLLSSTLTPPGSSGSRLLSGNSPLHLAFESSFGSLLSSPHPLLFNSGYVANLSILSSLPQPEDIVLLDEQVHNSIWSGARVSYR